MGFNSAFKGLTEQFGVAATFWVVYGRYPVINWPDNDYSRRFYELMFRPCSHVPGWYLGYTPAAYLQVPTHSFPS